MMQKIKVLHIGIKNWPYDSVFTSTNNKRGGGSNKYANILINGYSDKVESFIITQLVNGQKREEIYPNGIRVFRLKTFGGRKLRLIVLNVKSFFMAIKILYKFKFNVIHGHILPGIISALLVGRMFKIPVIATPYNVYDNGMKFRLNKIANSFEKYFYRHVDKLIFESNENRKKAQKLLNEPFDNSSVINTGIMIPNELFINDFLQKPLKLLFIGRLVKVKALDNLIKSFLCLKEEERKLIFLDIIGEGEEETKLNEIIEKNSLSDFIKIHGFVPDLNVFIKNANIFILPSHTEGLSIALLEAMSNGLACIVNDVGIPFSKKEVFIMKNNHPKTIAEALTYFINNPTSIKSFVELSLKRIEKDFSIRSFTGNYINNYEVLMRKT